jgi:hypothetical protein
MDRVVITGTEAVAPSTTAADLGKAQRIFSVSMLVSGIRCGLAYVVLPFVTPFLGLAPGVGPVLGIGIATVAIAANGFSLRRFWRLRHPWRKPITVLHIAVIAFLLVLIVLDVSRLLGG